MGIRLLSDNHFTEFKNEFKSVSNRLSIVTPFLSYPAINNMLNSISEHVEITLITRFKREDFINGLSNLEALSQLLDRGAKLYAVKELHTKLYLFDNETAIMGSANLTGGGLLKNVELSLLIKDESAVTDQLNEYYKELSELSKDFEIDKSLIKKENEIVQKIVNGRTNKNTYYTNITSWGADLPNEVRIDGLQEFLEEEIIEEDLEPGVTNWLKFSGTGDNLRNPDEIVKETKLFDGTTTEHFSRKPVGIKDGDNIYLTPLSWDATSRTPIVVGKAKARGFIEDNEVTEEDVKRPGYEWMQRWPYYIEIHDTQMIRDSIKNGVSLNKLLPELQSDFYVSTKGKLLTIQELKSRHHQKSHIKITNRAAKYIDGLLGFN